MQNNEEIGRERGNEERGKGESAVAKEGKGGKEKEPLLITMVSPPSSATHLSMAAVNSAVFFASAATNTTFTPSFSHSAATSANASADLAVKHKSHPSFASLSATTFPIPFCF